MSRPPARARRAIGVGLLLPGLLLTHPVTAHAQSKPAKPLATPSPHRGPTCTHTVRSGDTVSRIAARHRVSRVALVSANHLANPHALRLGQRLTVPGCRPPSVPRHGEAGGPGPAADGTVVKRVGPRRVLTELVLSEPDFGGESIALAWPVEGPVISSFGQRPGGWHAGVDIKAELAAPIYASAPGSVAYSGWLRAYGFTVKIQHSNGFMTVYAHNLKNLVEAGEEVEAGQLIATVGRTGHASSPHVHFEVRRDGKAYNPLRLLEPSEQISVLAGDVAASSSPLDSHE